MKWILELFRFVFNRKKRDRDGYAVKVDGKMGERTVRKAMTEAAKRLHRKYHDLSWKGRSVEVREMPGVRAGKDFVLRHRHEAIAECQWFPELKKAMIVIAVGPNFERPWDEWETLVHECAEAIRQSCGHYGDFDKWHKAFRSVGIAKAIPANFRQEGMIA